MNRLNRYYSLVQNGTEADINIYGDITSWAWEELGEMSAVNLSKQLEQLEGVSKINVYINSYGGEVAEGLAIYNSLKRHPAEIVTVCDGFACSIASVIFMAGDRRVMNEASLLMIHNAWTCAQGNAAELRKQARDLETITDASVAAYLANVNITETKLRYLMDAETWLSPAKALEYGFCTEIVGNETSNVSQNARNKVMQMILNPYMAEEEEEEETSTEETETEDESTEETETESTEEEEEVEETEEDETDEEETEEDEEPMQFTFFRAIQKMM